MAQFPSIFSRPSIVMDDPARGGITGGLPRLTMENRTSDNPTYRQLQNVFGDGSTANVEETPIGPGLNNVFGGNQNKDNLYTPETWAYDEMRKVYGDMPQRKEPGFLRKLGSGLVMLGTENPQVANNFRDRRYNEEMGQFNTRMNALGPIMNAERYQNANERMMANYTLRDQQAVNRLEQKDRTDREKLDIERQKLDLKKLHETKPDLIFQTDGTGMIVGLDKDSGKTIPTGIKSSHLTDLEKYAIDLDNKTKLEELRQKGRMSVVNTQEAGKDRRLDTTEEGKDKRTKVIEEGKNARVKSNTNKPLSETQKAAGLTNRARQIVTAHPEWKSYVEFTPSGAFKGIKKGGAFGFGGIDDATQKKIYEEIYQEPFTMQSTGKENAKPEAAKSNEAPKASAAPPPVEQRKKGMEFKFPNGNIGTWDGTKWVPKVVVTK